MTLRKFLRTDRRRRTWSAVLTWLIYVLMHIVALALVLANKNVVSDDMRAYRGMQAAQILGGNGADSMATIVIAIVLGIQSYAYLMSRRQVDFYESQPVSGKMRFFGGYLSSLIVFAEAYVVTAAAGLLVAVGMGAPAGEFLPQMVLQIVRSLVLFSSVFGVSALAAMLTGNLVITCLAICVLLAYEPALRFLLLSFAGTFFRTFYGTDGEIADAVTSPIAWLYRTEGTWNLWDGILIFVISMILARIAMRLRPREAAGCAVVFKPVRIIVKIAICLIAGMWVSLLVYTINDSAAAVILCTALGIFVVGCAMEVIYTYNFRALLKGLPATAAAAAAAIFIFCGYRYDWTGYDRWVPDPSAVESAYLIYNGYVSFSDSYESYAKKEMAITDIDALNKVLASGEAYTRKTYEEEPEASYEFIITYRMKDGSEAKRDVMIPDSTDPAAMAAVFDSDAFREGYYTIYHDEGEAENLDKLQIVYDTMEQTSATVPAATYYEKLRNAWMRDMENTSWEDLKKMRPVGGIEVQVKEDEYSEATEGLAKSLPVYATFSNTIAVLKEAGIYLDPPAADSDYQLNGMFNEYLDFEERDTLG